MSRKNQAAQTDVRESLTTAMTGIVERFRTNNQSKATILAEQEATEKLLVEGYGCPREDFSANSRTVVTVEAPKAKRGRKPSSDTPGRTRTATQSGGETQSEYILNWFDKRPDRTGSISDLKAHFVKNGRSVNTAAVMVNKLVASGFLKNVERGVYARTKKNS